MMVVVPCYSPQSPSYRTVGPGGNGGGRGGGGKKGEKGGDSDWPSPHLFYRAHSVKHLPEGERHQKGGGEGRRGIEVTWLNSSLYSFQAGRPLSALNGPGRKKGGKK